MPDLGDSVRNALANLLRELAEGANPKVAWILNPGDVGLLRSLDRLSAVAASTMPQEGGSSVAAHVDHLCYGLELLNRWSKGEEPFADADYTASWRRQSVSEEEWMELRDRLREELNHWGRALSEPRDLEPTDLTGVIASVAHLAYHLGAIRQINYDTRGPEADA